MTLAKCMNVAYVLGALVLCLSTVPVAQAQKTYLALIVGLAGEPEHGELFRRWAGTLVDHAAGRLGMPRDRITYLLEKPEQDTKRATGRSTKEEIDKALGALAAAAGEDDPVFIVLIGHGTFDGKVAKFNLPGPDMTPADFAVLLKRFASKKIVFVNTTSASGPFVEALAGPGRTIVTATRTGAERFSTLFGGYFVDALASDAADADKNRRVSVLEAFNAAKTDVTRAYEKQGIMITEHALLEDGGDGEGSLTPSTEAKDGRIAAILSLGTPTSALALPDDPQLRQLHEERRELEQRVESLKLLKAGMDPAKYAAEIEKLLTDLAMKTQQIRALEKKDVRKEGGRG
jgi:hypothetical protein